MPASVVTPTETGRLRPVDLLAAHHRRAVVPVPGHGELLGSPAVRGYPAAAPGLVELLDGLPVLTGRVADVSGSAGGGGLAGGDAEVEVLEPSFAALRAARERWSGWDRVRVRPGLPWDADPAGHDVVLLLPPGDRGNDRVRAELAAAAAALRPSGTAFALMHKDQGARRYERDAGAHFAHVEVVHRSRGWRLVRLAGPVPAQAPGAPPWRSFEALGRQWWALPGVFAARGLDVGSGVLLDALDAQAPALLHGASVLDLGCGTGVLAGAALDRGAARVTALDDDLGAVRSAERNLAGADATVIHSDVDAALPEDARFDVALVNPPFHVGKQVRLEVPRAFLAAAHARLRPGGTALIVANRALPYERELASWRRFETVRDERGFKVLRAWR